MPKLTIGGDARGAVKAATDMAKAIEKAGEEGDKTEKRLTKMEKAARRIQEANDPQKRYNRQIEETARLAVKGKIGIEDANKAAVRYGRNLDRAGKVGGRTFGGNALAQLTAYGAGIISVTSLVGLLTRSFSEAEKAAQGAADAAFGSLASQGELQQLTDNPQELAKINNYARQLIARGVFTPDQATQAFQTSFQLQSAGFSDAEKSFLADVGQSRFVGPESLVEFGGRLRKVQTGFGEDDTGGLEETLDKIVAAAKVTQSDASTIAGQIPEFASEAKALGIQFEEATAGFVAVEKRSPNPEIAKTRIRGFLNAVEKEELIVNGDLTDTLDALQAKLNSGKRLPDIISDSRARSGARNLLEARALGEITGLEQDINNSSGRFRAQSRLLQGVDPSFGLRLGKSEQEGQLSTSDFTRNSIDRETAFDIARAARIEDVERKYGSIAGGLARFGASLLDAVQLDDFATRQIVNNDDGTLTDANRARLEEYLRRTAEATESQVRKQPITTRAE